jgi:hypothetical protein
MRVWVGWCYWSAPFNDWALFEEYSGDALPERLVPMRNAALSAVHAVRS